ncbi:MAG: hypothetical protein U5R49_09200 [Deltaproteobacteria bacterium]|nr:hypothetical protein [Deltaproteobacteria bacterium]
MVAADGEVCLYWRHKGAYVEIAFAADGMMFGYGRDLNGNCVEARCPATGLMLPLAPSWIISEKYRVCAVLKRNDARQGYDIEIVTGADKDTFENAKKGTVQNGRLVCPETGETFSISSIRGDRRVGGETVYGLRLWENEDLVPRPDDVFQERLYCVRWVETLWNKTRRHYRSVDEDDLRREKKVLGLLKERFSEWQEKGFIPSRAIEPGAETSRLQKERGWTHWHHLFNPRQLLAHGELFSRLNKNVPANLIRLGNVADFNSKLTRYPATRETINNTFSNQALNTVYNFPVQGIPTM